MDAAPAHTAEPVPVEAPSSAPDSAGGVDAPSEREARGLSRLQLPERGTEMPAFQVTADDGSVVTSKDLVGVEPFVVVFFASWCEACERKMPTIRAALEESGKPIVALGVAMDAEETYGNVAATVARHGIPFRLVRGETAPELVQALDPRGSFPVLYVVDAKGNIVDVQIGAKPDHPKRLQQALAAVT